MSNSDSSIPESSSPVMREPINFLWIETYYDYIVKDRANKNSDIIWESEIRKLPFVNAFLQIQYQQTSESVIRLTCVRTVPLNLSKDIKPDHGYTLQLQCFINTNGYVYRQTFDILGEKTIAYEEFHLLSRYDSKPFESKILVKMIEYDTFPTDLSFQQETAFIDIKEKFSKDDSTLKDLCYILEVDTIDDIFTGRQDSDFTTLKCNYINRTAMFVSYIADYLRAKDKHNPLPNINLPLILNYIFSEKYEIIANNDLIRAYLRAHRLGLKFFVDLCRDYILKGILNPDLAIDILYAADFVNDEVLLLAAAQSFRVSEEIIMKSEKWLRMWNASIVKYVFVQYSLKRYVEKEWKRLGGKEILLSDFFKLD